MKAFNDQEKEYIKSRLFAAGIKCFSEFGLAKTTIADLTSGAGIAKSTFYKFFDTKEDLLIHILMNMRSEYINTVKNTIFSKYENDPYQCIMKFIKYSSDFIENDKITQRLMNKPQDLSLLAKKFAGSDFAGQKRLDSIEMISTVFEKWAKKGLLIEKSPKIMAGITRSVIMLVFFKKDIGEEEFQETIEFISGSVAKALIRNHGENKHD